MKVPAIRNKLVRIVRRSGHGKSAVPPGCRKASWDGRPAQMIEEGQLYLSGAAGFECAYEAGGRCGPYFRALPVHPPKEKADEQQP